jgi:hypothetical protein
VTFQNPSGLLLLSALPPAAYLLLRRLRRRERPVAAYFLLRDLVDSLPQLPRSYLLRRRLQALLFLAALGSAGLAAGGPVLGEADDPPLRMVLLLDPLVPGNDAGERAAAWERLAKTAAALVRPLRSDDRVVVLRPDGGTVGGGLLPSRTAARLIGRERSTLLYGEPAAAVDLAAIAAQAHAPSLVAVVTHDPERWRPLVAERDGTWRVVPVPAPADAGRNRALLDVEVRPDFLRRGRIDLYCRVGVFGPPGNVPEQLVLSVAMGEREIARRGFSLAPGVPLSEVFPALDAGAGLLEVRLSPTDAFPADNVFVTPLRPGDAVPVLLLTEENRPLETALRSVPGVRLSIARASSESAEPAAAIRVYDGSAPRSVSGNLLVIAPPEGMPGVGYRGDAPAPRLVRADPTHFLLAGVAVEGLRMRRLPIYELASGLEVVASADGHPLVAAGRVAGGSRVALLSFDPRDTGWSYTPSFPILIANIVAWLAESPVGVRSSFFIGDALPAGLARKVRAVADPAEAAVATPDGGWEAFRFTEAGRWRIAGTDEASSGEVFVNILDERISSAMAPTARPAGSGAPTEEMPKRPFRVDLQVPLLVAALALLFFEMLLAPRARSGRLP